MSQQGVFHVSSVGDRPLEAIAARWRPVLAQQQAADSCHPRLPQSRSAPGTQHCHLEPLHAATCRLFPDPRAL